MNQLVASMKENHQANHLQFRDINCSYHKCLVSTIQKWRAWYSQGFFQIIYTYKIPKINSNKNAYLHSSWLGYWSNLEEMVTNLAITLASHALQWMQQPYQWLCKFFDEDHPMPIEAFFGWFPGNVAYISYHKKMTK